MYETPATNITALNTNVTSNTHNGDAISNNSLICVLAILLFTVLGLIMTCIRYRSECFRDRTSEYDSSHTLKRAKENIERQLVTKVRI